MRPCFFVSLLALAACSSQPIVDRPDATLDWPTRRVTYTPPLGGMGLVSDSLSDQVSLLDLAGNTTMANVRVGIEPLGNDGPHHLALDATAGRVFVALSYPPPGVPSGPHAGHGTSTVPGWVQTLALSDLHEVARQEIDPNPGDIVLTHDRQRVIVSHFNLAAAEATLGAGGSLADAMSRLWVLDANDLHVIKTEPICVMAHGVAVSADDTRAYVACNGQDSLAVVHLDDPDYMVEPLIPVAPGVDNTHFAENYGPYAILLTADGAYAIVSDRDGGDIRVFNIAMHAFENNHVSLTMVRRGMFFGTESVDGRFVWLASQSPDGIVRLARNGGDWEVDAIGSVTAAQCVLPHEVARGPDNRFYLVCEGDHATPSHVVVFDPMFATGAVNVTASFDVGVFPDRVVFAGGVGSDP